MNSHYYYKQYDDDNIRIICSKTDLKKKKEKKKIEFKDLNETDSDEVKRISQSRVKRKIRELLLCNDFDYFCTWTIDSKLGDRFALEDSQEKIRKIIQQLSRIQKRNNLPKVEYLLVTEKHQNGAFHFHGCIKNMIMGNYTNENGYLSNEFFDLLGYQSFSPIKNKTACANYIMKYITKDSIQNEKGSYYFRSHGLNKPSGLNEILPIDFKIFTNPFGETMYFENEFTKVVDIQFSRIPKYTLEYLNYNMIDKK